MVDVLDEDSLALQKVSISLRQISLTCYRCETLLPGSRLCVLCSVLQIYAGECECEEGPRMGLGGSKKISSVKDRESNGKGKNEIWGKFREERIGPRMLLVQFSPTR